MYDQLISIETAKLAYEKGFNIPVINCYNENSELGDIDELEYINYNRWDKTVGSNQNLYSAPTQSGLQKWLREIHNIEVLPYPVQFLKNDIEQECCNLSYHYKLIIKGFTQFVNLDNEKSTYEEAFELGLYNALKRIEII